MTKEQMREWIWNTLVKADEMGCQLLLDLKDGKLSYDIIGRPFDRTKPIGLIMPNGEVKYD